tara:strand:+ start:1286 stop:2191 length:906 start_codon:yes stop_codon:yes gene_type:complete
MYIADMSYKTVLHNINQNQDDRERDEGMGEDDTTHPKFLFKIIMVGDSGVGKSSLLQRYIKRSFFLMSDSTIGVDFSMKKVRVSLGTDTDKEKYGDGVQSLLSEYGIEDKPLVKMQIWDTAGHERFNAIVTTYFRNATGCILVYDINQLDTAANVEYWHSKVKAVAEDISVVVVGNKWDLVHHQDEDVLHNNAAKQFADFHGYPHLELSAKINQNVDHMFETLANRIYREMVIPALGNLDKNTKSTVKITDIHTNFRNNMKNTQLGTGIVMYNMNHASVADQSNLDLENKEKETCPFCTII